MTLENISNNTFKSCAFGAKVLTLLQHFTPDMILLDVTILEMGGFETLKRIREFEAFKKTPVIFMAGCLLSELIDNLRQLGAVETIAKSFSPMQISVHVRTFWNQYG